MDRLATNVAQRYIEAKGEATFEEFERAVQAGMAIQEKVKKWAEGFPRKLRQAIEKTDLNGEWVWWDLYQPILDDGYTTLVKKTLPYLRERIDELGTDLGFDYNYLNPIGNALSPEAEASSRAVFDGGNTQYLPPNGVALNVELIEKWHQKLLKWVDYWTPILKKTLQAAKKSYKRKVKRMR